MKQLELLFGQSTRWFSLLFWLAVALSLAGAIVPIVFILYTGFLSADAVSSVRGFVGILSDYRHVQAIVNSFYLAFFLSIALTLISTIAAFVFRWADLTGNALIYSLCVIPLLIPDYVFGVAGRVVCDPSVGILSDWLPKTLLIERFSALSLVAVVAILKWLPAMIVVADSSILSMGQDELYQVRMDYQSFYKAARFVYLPRMKGVLLIIASLGFLIGFRQHELAYELTSGGGGFVAETWSFWNYGVMYDFAKLAPAAVESLLIIVLLTIPIQVVRKQAQYLTAYDNH